MKDSNATPSRPLARASASAAAAAEVLWVFLLLGLTSFGGPVAHLGYFRAAFVQRRSWLGERDYADLVALCQLLPGPASSQVGMAIGLRRAGGWGALAAWVGFTLPSAALMVAVAMGLNHFPRLAQSGLVHGLQLAAVAVVAQAVWGMGRAFCGTGGRLALAAAAMVASLALPSPLTQAAVILLCGVVGARVFGAAPGQAGPPAIAHQAPVPRASAHRRWAAIALATHLALFTALWLAAVGSGGALWQLAQGVYRAGSLVFGGGHVVLPLLESVFVQRHAISEADFLAGYGAAQAMPGPLFSFAAYLGAMVPSVVPRAVGALLFLALLFLPGALVLLAALPFWGALQGRPGVRAAMAGVNAGVVGILAAALVDPVIASAVKSPADIAIAAAAFALLVRLRWPPVLVVGLTAAAAVASVAASAMGFSVV